MNNETISEIGNKIHKLRNITVLNNHSDNSNLGLLIQSLVSLQKMISGSDNTGMSAKYLALLEKEVDYFLFKYNDEAKELSKSGELSL
ncbi:MAG: hypothetical protein U9Q40_10365 [Campylobacterota bacterium]|nr:hypothetical protein [Campylobacterota bacterium]